MNPDHEILDYDYELPHPEPYRATKWTRFLNLVLDTFIFGWLEDVLLGMPSFVEFIMNTEIGYDWLLPTFLMTFYYVISEYAFGKSPAKFLTRTKVVSEFGERPDLGKLLVRNFVRIIPFEALSFLGSKGIGWHDSLSKTYVVIDIYGEERPGNR